MKNRLKFVLIRPSTDYNDVPVNLRKYFPIPSGNYYKEPPMGILYVAAACIKANIKVKVIDQYLENITNKQVVEKIKRYKPDFVGISLTSFTLKNSVLIAGMIRKTGGKPQIVVGGPWVSMDKENILSNKEFDFAVYGEGEITTPELLNNFKNTKKYFNIEGLIFRNNGKVIINKSRDFIKDLDTLAYPAYDLVNINKYSRSRSIYVDTGPVDYMCATRGCPYGCSFCSSKEVWNRRYRVRDPKKVVEEMVYMSKRFGTKGFHFRDDNLTVNKKFITGLCRELIDKKLGIKWMCESRVDTVDEEIIKLMKEAGCTGIWFGIESGSQKILDYLNKGIKLNRITDTVKICQKYGLKLGGSFMLGVPQETPATLEKTIDFAKSLKLTNTWFNQFIAIPNCELYNEVLSKKMFKYGYNGNLIVETKHYSSDKLYDIVRKNNLYFEMKRLGLILKTHHISEYPKMATYAFGSFLSIIKRK